MAAISRDPHFSMSLATPIEVKFSSTEPRISYGKRLERQLINLWKMLTRPRTKQRASFMPPDFVSLTSRRRSTMTSQFYNRVRA
ncbi:hypothetical protein DFP72DRAFT_628567 [Ephemerocybe angulata]|uniref:Uncharacterized protein n=1 Tax=Ephemerocybe angulata TaxID=980116 RepID=A0A8H6IC61_9AGAR|nr:hypothetical protein DFP72DRAFT_628567 [Tulosesus angulatus]